MSININCSYDCWVVNALFTLVESSQTKMLNRFLKSHKLVICMFFCHSFQKNTQTDHYHLGESHLSMMRRSVWSIGCKQWWTVKTEFQDSALPDMVCTITVWMCKNYWQYCVCCMFKFISHTVCTAIMFTAGQSFTNREAYNLLSPVLWASVLTICALQHVLE